MSLSDTLREMARKVDVRVPILPPPPLAPALLAAADELERLEQKINGQREDVARIRAKAAEQGKAVSETIAALDTHWRALETATERAAQHDAAVARLRKDAAQRLAKIEAARERVEQDRLAIEQMRTDAEQALADLSRVRSVVEAARALRSAMDGA